MNKNEKEFLKEFKELLNKYNVEIECNWADCSDFHGVYDLHLVIKSKENNINLRTEDCYINIKEISKNS